MRIFRIISAFFLIFAFSIDSVYAFSESISITLGSNSITIKNSNNHSVSYTIESDNIKLSKNALTLHPREEKNISFSQDEGEIVIKNDARGLFQQAVELDIKPKSNKITGFTIYSSSASSNFFIILLIAALIYTLMRVFKSG